MLVSEPQAILLRRIQEAAEPNMLCRYQSYLPYVHMKLEEKSCRFHGIHKGGCASIT